MVLSNWKFGTFFSVNFGWGIGVTLGCYWAGGISGNFSESIWAMRLLIWHKKKYESSTEIEPTTSDLLDTEKSGYFLQPRSIISNVLQELTWTPLWHWLLLSSEEFHGERFPYIGLHKCLEPLWPQLVFMEFTMVSWTHTAVVQLSFHFGSFGANVILLSNHVILKLNWKVSPFYIIPCIGYCTKCKLEFIVSVPDFRLDTQKKGRSLSRIYVFLSQAKKVSINMVLNWRSMLLRFLF